MTEGTGHIHLTLALTAHSETIVAGPTIASARAALRALEAGGYSAEAIIGLDRATDGCRAFFSQPSLSDWPLGDLDFGDLGASRNALAELARGEVVAFLDADDLFSENWLLEGVRRLEKAKEMGEDLILHPELNVFFDAANSMLLNISQRDELYLGAYWAMRNYYDSLAMAPRRAFLDAPYAVRDRARNLGYEDWRWNLDTIARGWRHEIAPDTIIFKRRRDSSLVTELQAEQALLWPLEPLAIDGGL
ncbi:MAG: glycosyltransferase [Pikeienuella sp.]